MDRWDLNIITDHLLMVTTGVSSPVLKLCHKLRKIRLLILTPSDRTIYNGNKYHSQMPAMFDVTMPSTVSTSIFVLGVLKYHTADCFLKYNLLQYLASLLAGVQTVCKAHPKCEPPRRSTGRDPRNFFVVNLTWNVLLTVCITSCKCYDTWLIHCTIVLLSQDIYFKRCNTFAMHNILQYAVYWYTWSVVVVHCIVAKNIAILYCCIPTVRSITKTPLQWTFAVSIVSKVH